MNWDKNAVIKKIEALPNVTVTEEPPGGDWDLIHIHVRPGNSKDAIVISPFVDPDGPSVDFENWEVPQPIAAVEIRNLQGDSRGGCHTDNATVMRLYTEIRIIVADMGHRTVDHYDELF